MAFDLCCNLLEAHAVYQRKTEAKLDRTLPGDFLQMSNNMV